MNKKLLLILSILMSLSLFTISCAKSVAAPDMEAQELTAEIITTQMQSLGKIVFDRDSLGKDIYYDFINCLFQYSENDKCYVISGLYFSYTDSINISKSKLLNAIYPKLASVEYFKPDRELTMNMYMEPVLNITVSSANYRVPEEFKNIKIIFPKYVNQNWVD